MIKIKLMSIKYYFVIYAIILISLPIAKASEYVFFQKETSIIITSNVLGKSVFLNQEVNSLSLLDKVVIVTHPGNQNFFWKGVVSVFHKVRRVYGDLWSYLFDSIFSIFNW
ncbi:hypothetical protein [Bartonella birtlesii]|uniref:hypothetical protein n=1 Tax=Bartonella birtlesii TaxID=111504 RepID=UPI00037705AD|nr:hypothetical protein [Bartonella birtlesii]